MAAWVLLGMNAKGYLLALADGEGTSAEVARRVMDEASLENGESNLAETLGQGCDDH